MFHQSSASPFGLCLDEILDPSLLSTFRHCPGKLLPAKAKTMLRSLRSKANNKKSPHYEGDYTERLVSSQVLLVGDKKATSEKEKAEDNND